MKITITGVPGSGKSTLAKYISKVYNRPYISAGKIQRKLAEERGLTTAQMLAVTDADIDHMIDNETVNQAKLPSNCDAIFDGRLTWHFVPDSYKVFVWARPSKAAERIYLAEARVAEKYTNLDEAIEATRTRYFAEIAQYKKVYGLDLTDMSNYDLVIDATYLGVEDCAKFIMDKLAVMAKGIYLDIQNMIPTQRITTCDALVIDSYYKDIVNRKELKPIKVAMRDGKFYIVDGHHRYIALGKHMEYKTPDLFVKVEFDNIALVDKLPQSFLYDYEDALDVSYAGYGYDEPGNLVPSVDICQLQQLVKEQADKTSIDWTPQVRNEEVYEQCTVWAKEYLQKTFEYYGVVTAQAPDGGVSYNCDNATLPFDSDRLSDFVKGVYDTVDMYTRVFRKASRERFFIELRTKTELFDVFDSADLI